MSKASHNPKLTITVGLPCSGKTTWAETERSADPTHVRIVNRDDIRASLGARFEDGDEQVVAEIRDFQIMKLLSLGYHVICSDTNLSMKVQRRLADVAARCSAPVQVNRTFLDVPLDTCLYRNERRWMAGNKKVPNSAIVQMHDQFVKDRDES